MLVTYVSGHGFGHSTRTAEVLRVVRALRPELPLTIVTKAPEGLFREAIPGDITYRKVGLDVGLAQADALGIDLDETIGRLNALEELLPAPRGGRGSLARGHRSQARARRHPSRGIRRGCTGRSAEYRSRELLVGLDLRSPGEGSTGVRSPSAAPREGGRALRACCWSCPSQGTSRRFRGASGFLSWPGSPRRSRAEAREQLGLGHAPPGRASVVWRARSRRARPGRTQRDGRHDLPRRVGRPGRGHGTCGGSKGVSSLPGPWLPRPRGARPTSS